MRFDGDVATTASDEWTIVVPVKQLSAAKSRMTSAGLSDVGALALAFFQDTLAATTGFAAAPGVIVATSDARVAQWAHGLGCRVFDDSSQTGINAAARAAAASIEGNLAVLVSDLPCATPAALATWLDSAAQYATAFVADAAGTGTTMWTRRAGQPIDTRFGERSRAAHRAAGAVDLAAQRDGNLPDEDAADRARLRRDVDTPEDLADALRIGVGPHTAAAVVGTDLI
jgi:2-phospho-L-lactate guanylyltransferase